MSQKYGNDLKYNVLHNHFCMKLMLTFGFAVGRLGGVPPLTWIFWYSGISVKLTDGMPLSYPIGERDL